MSRRSLAAPNTEILECSQTWQHLHLDGFAANCPSRSSKDEDNVVKPHGRLVPVS
jgi:hypothetical protein